MFNLYTNKAEAFLYIALAPLAACFGAVCAKIALTYPLF